MAAAWQLLAICLTCAITAHGLQYIGCYIDQSDRDLPDKAAHGDVSINRCNSLCASKGNMFFGLQNSNECWCGSSYGRHGVVPSSQCNKQCSGERSAVCGSNWRNSVYATDFGATGIRYVGCFADSSDRDLPALVGHDAMSINRCNSLCRDKAYAYSGLQNGNECWCGNDYGKHGVKPEAECNKRCSGDKNSFCGSNWRNNVYATGYRLLSLPGGNGPLSAQVKTQLAAQIKSQQTGFPSGVMCDTCLIAAWSRRDAEIRSKTFPMTGLSSEMSSYPAGVKEKLKALQFGANAKTQFEDFRLTISGNYVVRSSYIGVANRLNGTVEIGVINAELVAYLVPKHHVFKKQSCTKIWFWTKCRTDTIRKGIGYQPNEIDFIDQAMRSETFKIFSQKLG